MKLVVMLGTEVLGDCERELNAGQVGLPWSTREPGALDVECHCQHLSLALLLPHAILPCMMASWLPVHFLGQEPSLPGPLLRQMLPPLPFGSNLIGIRLVSAAPASSSRPRASRSLVLVYEDPK